MKLTKKIFFAFLCSVLCFASPMLAQRADTLNLGKAYGDRTYATSVGGWVDTIISVPRGTNEVILRESDYPHYGLGEQDVWVFCEGEFGGVDSTYLTLGTDTGSMAIEVCNWGTWLRISHVERPAWQGVGSVEVVVCYGPAISHPACPSAALPVLWVSVDAQALTSSLVNVQATIGRETNSLGMKVFRETDLDTGQLIGWIPSQGDTESRRVYEFIDSDLPYGATKATYSFTQVDVSGQESRSSSVEVNLILDEDVVVYPNPASEFVMIQSPKGMVRISNLQGRLVYQSSVAAGRHDVSGLSSGLYYVEITPESEFQRRKTLKLVKN